jgi:hypothetical protein
MQNPSMRNQAASRSSSHSFGRRVLAMLALVTATLGLAVAPANAQGPPPRLIPSRVPAGYTLADYFDRQRPPSVIRYIRYYRNQANTAAAYLEAEPAQKSEWTSIESALKNLDATPVSIRGLRGYRVQFDNEFRIYWFEKNRVLLVKTVGVNAKLTLAMAVGVGVTRLADASFTAKKIAPGLGLVYAGGYAGLFGPASGLLYKTANGDQISFEVAVVDRRAFDVFLLSPFVTYGTTTVNGKPAYVIEDTDSTEVWWEEQPGLLIEVIGDGLNVAGLVDVGSSLVPTDEAAWQALTAATESAGTAPPVDGTTPVTPVTPGTPGGELVGAGTVDGVPWTANPGSGPTCLKFTSGGVAAEACVKAPNSLGWVVISANGKTFAFGVAAANVTTAVARNGGTELGRAVVGPVANQPLLRLFVIPLAGGPAGVSIAGLDSTGAEISPPIPAGI